MRYAKAIVAALVAAGGSLVVALGDDRLTSGEWMLAIVAALTALGATWAVPNKPGRTVRP